MGEGFVEVSKVSLLSEWKHQEVDCGPVVLDYTEKAESGP